MDRHSTRELLALHDIRLDEGLSYRVMALQIGVGETVLYRSLHRLSTPSERTLHRMREFLANRKPAKRRAS